LAAPEPVSEDVIGGDVFDTIIADTLESREE
jgi:DNA-directed RNA polymerase subunit beta'